MPLAASLLEPIPGASPCGENLYYASIYEKVKEARRQEEDVPQGEWRYEVKKADYPLVIKLTTDALASKSKDLQLAVWLTEALLHQQGIPGLDDGLSLLRGLLEQFWDGLYPELEDGDAEMRAAPLAWVGVRLGDAVRSVPLTKSGLDCLRYKESRGVPTEADASASEAKAQARETAIAEGKLPPEQFDAAFDVTPAEFTENTRQALDSALASLQTLGELSDEKFGDVAPNFAPLRTALEEMRQTLRILSARRGTPAAEETQPRPEAEAESYYAATEEAAAPPRRFEQGEPGDQEDAFRRIASVAAYLRRESPYSPVPFLLLRGLRWGELRTGGSTLDETLLEAPPTEVRQNLKRLALDGLWEEVLGAAETAMASPCGRGWLDLQRYVVRACEELGGYYEPIALAVRAEVKGLLGDFPQLRSSTLTDDTPAANPETQSWLDGLVSVPAEPAVQQPDISFTPAAPAAEDGEAPATLDAYALAVQAMQSNRPQEAIEILSQEVAQVRSGRLRFQRKVQLAQVCIASGHENVARPILEDIGKEIEQRGLEDWEAPDMLAQPLVLLLRCMDKLDGSPEERQRIYSRICRLDPLQALSVSK